MSTGTMTGTQCPTSNTRSFAKTRFVSDLGGAAFLIRRYLYQPYTQGSFTKGHSGRTVALLKAVATTATVVHLLKNASLNAKANPTLCKLVAAPLSSLTSTVSGFAGSLTGGGSGLGVLGSLGGAVTGLLGKSKSAGVPVTEQAPYWHVNASQHQRHCNGIASLCVHGDRLAAQRLRAVPAAVRASTRAVTTDSPTLGFTRCPTQDHLKVRQQRRRD